MTARPQADDLLRLARSPRWLGLALVALVLIVGCVLLGRWQWDRTQNIVEAERVAVSAPIAVEAVAAVGEPLPDDSIGRPVEARGRYLAGGQVIVMQRSLRGLPGVWVLTPLELSDGSVIGVLRGWLESAAEPGIVPPSGEVLVSGIMHPDERFYPDAVTEPGTAVAISSARQRDSWGPATRSGYVMLTATSPRSDDPSGSEPPAPEPAAPTVQTAGVPFPLQNFFYAFQWWIFAAFVAVVYVRWLWLDATDVRASAAERPDEE
jgi:cytochrome oxidase assembly protein ShyY1